MSRTLPDISFEDSYPSPLCGVDEAGRGPLAGPVVAACVHVPPPFRQKLVAHAVNDSKKLPKRRRLLLFKLILEGCAYGVGSASAEEIDTMNIHNATLLAMARGYHAMKTTFAITTRTTLVDGKFAPKLDCFTVPVIGGDGLSLSVAAASIIAKVTRDNLMEALAREYPSYGWSKNAGYGTAEHLAALEKHGPTPHHRRSYAPVGRVLAAQDRVS